MAIEVTLPRQGWSMEEAAFVEWLKKDGEAVTAGEPLFSVETDKAVQEIESLDAGILRLTPRSPKAGDKVRVADVLGYLVAPGEAAPAVTAAPGPKADDAPAPTARPAAPTTAIPAPCAPSVTAGRPVSPRAARRAIEAGVDLRTVRGTGRGGRVRERDVLAAARTQGGAAPPPPTPSPSQPAVPPVPGRAEKITTLRRTIAERMHRSKTLAAPVTLTTRVDAGALVRLREGLKAQGTDRAVPAYGDIILREVAQALLEHPALNARWENEHLRFPDAVNIGFAVDTDAGLVVPVVRDAPRYDLRDLADLTRDLAERARARRLSPEDLSGGTFTVTNLGMAGVDAFTPIVNWPECAVLGIGRITQEPVVQGRKVVVGQRLWLSLTFDHRIVDGAPAARFLDRVRERVEDLGPAAVPAGTRDGRTAGKTTRNAGSRKRKGKEQA